ncbi:reverse transcriptase domain-containing protein [Tanacetum coccineum]
MEEFVRRYKLECRDVKGAPECMKISGFMHGITNPELIKRLHDKIPKLVDEMMRKQIKELLKERKLPHLIKELKQNNGKEQPKVTKKGETFRKDKARLRPEIRKQLIPATTPLIGFSGEIIWPIGEIQLLVKIGDKEHSASAWMNFMVVRSSSPYNGFIGIPGVRKLQAVPSIAHGMLKILVEGGVITLKSSKLVPLECTVVYGPEGAPSATKPIIEERIKKPADMTGVPRHIAEHRLNVRDGCSPVRQKKRGQVADRNHAIQEEVGKLVKAGIMKEGLKVFPDKMDAMLSLPSPKCLKDVQKLNGKLASLNRFLAKSVEKSLPFFKTLKKCTKKSDFNWTTEAEEAFKQMKQLIAEIPMLTAPMEKEELIVYLAATKETVSAVLMTEREAK